LKRLKGKLTQFSWLIYLESLGKAVRTLLGLLDIEGWMMVPVSPRVFLISGEVSSFAA